MEIYAEVVDHLLKLYATDAIFERQKRRLATSNNAHRRRGTFPKSYENWK